MADSSSSASLRAWLASFFRENGGEVSFEQFMAEALYHPEFGYYTKHIRTVGGSRGDFATSPTLSTLLGKAIADWICEESETLALSSPIHVIEIGGGEGSLMRDVIAAHRDREGGWRRWLSRGRGRFRYHLVDVSARLRQRQQETLRPFRKVLTWHEKIESALEAAGGKAIIFSNELVDAFPAMALRWQGEEEGEGWQEIGVKFDPDQGLAETFRSLAESRPGLNADDFGVLRSVHDWPRSQRVEIHDSYRKWIQKWAPLWEQGSILTIDYGSQNPDEIYQRRPEGSLRAFFRHQRLSGAGLYRLFGKQDLTADVNFDDLERWGAACGWKNDSLVTQADFLRRHATADCERARSTDRSAAFLFEPEGAGEAFQVLAQRKIQGRSVLPK